MIKTSETMTPENKTNPKGTKQPAEPADLSNLSNDALLENLANSPCANRHVPTNQSLEDYLLSTKPMEQNKKLPPRNMPT